MSIYKKNMAQNNELVFFDANVLIEIVDNRKLLKKAVALIKASSDKAAVSALTAHLVMYFGSKTRPLGLLQHFLSDFIMLPLEQTDFDWAFANNRNVDFEDTLQLAVAIRHGCDRFITFDKKLYRDYRDLPSIRLELY